MKFVGTGAWAIPMLQIYIHLIIIRSQRNKINFQIINSKHPNNAKFWEFIFISTFLRLPHEKYPVI